MSSCSTCRYEELDLSDPICEACEIVNGNIFTNWKAVPETTTKEQDCDTCKFAEVDGLKDPCFSCKDGSNWRDPSQARFADAKVGDKVYSRIHGFGTIGAIDNGKLVFVGECYDNIYYFLDGRFVHTEIEPLLFYVDGDNKYSEIRPGVQLDWSKIPLDTRVLYTKKPYSTQKGHYAGIGKVWARGRSKWSSQSAGTVNCDEITLYEDIKIEGVLYPKGTKWTK